MVSMVPEGRGEGKQPSLLENSNSLTCRLEKKSEQPSGKQAMARVGRRAKKMSKSRHKKSWEKSKRFARKENSCRYSSENYSKEPVKKKKREKGCKASLTGRGGELQLAGLISCNPAG